MTTSRTIPLAVYLAEQRFNALLALESRELTVAQLAESSRCAPSTLYLRKVRVLDALMHKRPGPKPGQRELLVRAQRAEQRVVELQRQLDEARAAALRQQQRTDRELLAIKLTCHKHGMPLRGIQDASPSIWNFSGRIEVIARR